MVCCAVCGVVGVGCFCCCGCVCGVCGWLALVPGVLVFSVSFWRLGMSEEPCLRLGVCLLGDLH